METFLNPVVQIVCKVRFLEIKVKLHLFFLPAASILGDFTSKPFISNRYLKEKVSIHICNYTSTLRVNMMWLIWNTCGKLYTKIMHNGFCRSLYLYKLQKYILMHQKDKKLNTELISAKKFPFVKANVDKRSYTWLSPDSTNLLT